MLITWILLWTLALILRLKNKTDYISWLSWYTFCTGCGALADVLEKIITPAISRITNNSSAIFLSQLLTNLAYSIGYGITEYTFLVFSILYSGVFRFTSGKQKNIIIGLLSLPAIISFLLYPRSYFPLNAVPPTVFRNMSFWTVPYVIIGCIYLISGYLKEMNLRLKKEKLLTIALVIPPTLFSVYACYITMAMNIKNMYVHNEYFVVIAIISFYLLALKYGFWEVKIKLEQQHLDNTMKAVSSGTSLLNHTLKNEVAKIKMCLHDLSDKYKIESDDDIHFINVSTAYITQMLNRIQEKTQDITLIIHEEEVNQIIDKALLQSKPLLESKKITVNKHYIVQAVILCDEIHLREVICNLFNNSIEAMQESGELNIDIYKNKKELIIEIKDNGTGIKKEHFSHIFEPFFTTKNRQFNYGLGLTYCYNVMKEHKGSIEIISEEGKGTSVLLKFPLSKVVRSIINHNQVHHISNPNLENRPG